VEVLACYDAGMRECFLIPPTLLPTGIHEFEHGYEGVTSQFLDDAAAYDAKYTDIEHWRSLLQFAFQHAPPIPSEPLILDMGCGSGNTVIPMLDGYPGSHVVAADISPNLLLLLQRRLKAKGALERSTIVSMDLCAEDRIRPNSFDLVVGGSILHHLLDPATLLQRVCGWLRPGGFAVFFEPFAIGNVILAMLHMRLIANQRELRLGKDVVQALERIVVDTRTRVVADPGDIPRMDDKWLFTRSSLQEAVRGRGSVRVIGMNSQRQFEVRTREILRFLAGHENLPEAAWKIIREFDALFGLIADEALLMGCIIVVADQTERGPRHAPAPAP